MKRQEPHCPEQAFCAANAAVNEAFTWTALSPITPSKFHVGISTYYLWSRRGPHIIARQRLDFDKFHCSTTVHMLNTGYTISTLKARTCTYICII